MTGADDTEDDSDGASRPGVNSRLIGTEHARFDQFQERLAGESALALPAPIAKEWQPVVKVGGLAGACRPAMKGARRHDRPCPRSPRRPH